MQVAYEIVKNIFYFVAAFYVIYLAVYSGFLLLSVTVGSISLYEQRTRQRMYNFLNHDYYMPVSIIVPAYNEELTVVDTVRSLLNLDYRLYEIIVVDDGSSDKTCEVLIDSLKMEKLERPLRKKVPCKNEIFIYATQAEKVRVTLIRKENGGKADALNVGINASEYPYFVCMDADSMLQHDALTNIARPLLESNNVVACGGLVRIVNDITLRDGKVVDYNMPHNLVLCMQVLEYDRSFLASRLLFDKFNGNLIISGAFGLFKKDVVIAAGGYDSSLMGEDMELVVRLHAYCRSNNIDYRIKYAADAVCWSQAPETLDDLRKQRRRWHIGLFQSLWNHRSLIFNPAYGLISLVSFIYFLVYELLSPYIEIFGIITIIAAAAFNIVNVSYMFMLMLLYSVFTGILSITAFFARIHAMEIKMHTKDMLKVISLCLIETLVFRTILSMVRLTAFRKYSSGKHHWGQIKRIKMNT